MENFLATVCEFGELYGFTAGTSEYGLKAFPILDPQGKLFKNILYRDSCGYNYSKDLSKVGKGVYIPTRSVLIDDMDRSFISQPENGLLIPGWCSDEKDDSVFVHTLTFLRELEYVDDIRPSLKKFNEERSLFEIRKKARIDSYIDRVLN